MRIQLLFYSGYLIFLDKHFINKMARVDLPHGPFQQLRIEDSYFFSAGAAGAAGATGAPGEP